MKRFIQSVFVLLLMSGVAFAQPASKADEKAAKKAAKLEAKASKKASKGANGAKETPPSRDAVAAPSTPAPAVFPVAPDQPQQANVVVDSLPPTTIAFDQDTYDFGKIKQGDVVKHEFTFTNTGKNPLVLENVKPSCGCTAIDWPKEPIPPGGKGKIGAQFNSAGKAGQQMKYITIVYNGDPKITRVTFTGEIILPEGAAPAPGGH